MMVKILHVVPTLGYGGVAKVVTNYYEAIDHNRYHFDFVTHGGVEDYHESLINQGSKIFYFQTIGKLGARKYCQQIKKMISVAEYDIIHIHTGDITGVYAKCYHQCGAKKIICHAHTTRAVSKSHKIFETVFRKMALKYSDATMACGYEAGEYCFGKDHFVLLPNSIDYSAFNDVDEKTKKHLLEEFNIPEERFIVGHIGHFSPPKNHFYLLDIAEAYIKVNPNVYFMLCGNGPRFEEVKQRIKAANMEKNIILTGIRNDVNALMQIFDAFVLPSLHEGLPVVGIEAQTAGLHCLLSDQIDHRVDIGCELCEFLPINDGVDVWVDALDRLCQNPEKKKGEVVLDALKKQGYDISSTRKILTEVYDSLVKQ